MSIRVVVADDSPTVCAALRSLLQSEPDIEVVGVARDGFEALELARTLRPDLITMDVRMPRMDGLEATAAIMASAPTRILAVCAVTEQDQQDLSFRAMAVGALEVVAKPPADADLRAWGRRVAESIRLMAEVPVITRRRGLPGPRWRSPLGARVDVVGIVASTGGPPAIAKVLSSLPPQLPVPIFIAQHMAQGFADGLVRWLSSVSPLPVSLARSGAHPEPGHAYLAPDGCDLVVDHEGIIEVPPTTGGHCPNGDKLLLSLARTWGSRAAGFVLTGMGDDGAKGLAELRRLGGPTFAQHEADCVVFGMPRAAKEADAVDQMVSLETVGPLIRELAERRRDT